MVIASVKLIGMRLWMLGATEMINKLFFLCVMFLFVSCTLDIQHEPTGPHTPTPYVENSGASYIEVVWYDDHSCYEEPYWYAPEWCEWYSDDTQCCAWYADGWFEEFCQWGAEYCWEYNGSF